ncbi:transposase [Streptomyces cinereoruber]|uniref:transposase n=1 Tax=Streptomyces cinereoruber TaxID=67260 RepID=UPI003C2BDB23
MTHRHDLSAVEWEFAQPLLPVSLRGRKRLDDRRVLNGIVWKFHTGVARRDVPERYGPWATLHTRFRRWAMNGTFDRMLRAAQAKADAAGDVEWVVSVDSTVVRAHQHASGPITSWATGLQLEADPHLAATPEHPAHDPRAGRSDGRPGPARQSRRPPAFDREA